MNNLKGKYVNVVLAIEMGRGLDFLEHPVKIVAHFNGRPLESDLVAQDDCPTFNIELVWETEKKELRKVRSTNAPLRVEVFTVDSNQKKDRIGFALLSPRCANVIPFDSKLEIPFKWQKLLGISAEYKNKHPELNLSLTIRDLCRIDQLDSTYLSNVTIDEENETPSEESFEKDGEVVSIRYMPNGYIQIGNDNYDEMFLLTINIQVAYNLDLLLPEVLVFHQNREKYYISFRMFGITIKSKPFCRDLHANIPMKEKIVVRIRSVYDILRTYLTDSCRIHVNFSCGCDKLGTTSLCVDTLLKDVSEEQFQSQLNIIGTEQKCFFKFPSPHGIIPSGSNGRQPYIEVEASLQRTESQTLIKSPRVTETKDEVAMSELKIDPIDIRENSLAAENLPSGEDNGCGDKGIVNKEEELKEGSRSVSASGDQNEPEFEIIEVEAPESELELQMVQEVPSTENETTELPETQVKSSTSLYSCKTTTETEDFAASNVFYQKYCLDIVLESITLKKHIHSSKLFFKFKHPKASTAVISDAEKLHGEDIILENTRCKMFFVSTNEHVRKMVYAWPPKLVMFDENDQQLTEELDLYTAMFLAKNRMECSYMTEWKAVRTYEPLAKISISMYLQEYGLNALPNETECELLPPILDEEIVVKELQELQEWKQLQKVRFSADLRIVEKQRLAEMQRKWNRKKRELEQKLNASIARCQKLSSELQHAVNMVRIKQALEQKEIQMNIENGSHEDNSTTTKYSEYESEELIETISKLERDNEHLKEIINDQRQEIQQIRKTALTKEQTTSLLQELRGLEEKFEDAQKAKRYFKDQWKKAVMEIHELRAEDQKQIQERIKNQKVELTQLSLDSYLGDNNDYGGLNRFTTSDPNFIHGYKWDDLNFSNITTFAGKNNSHI